jgi:surface protein
MALPQIYGFTRSGSTYTQNADMVIDANNPWTRVNFGVLTQNVIIDGNGKTITYNANGLNGLFSGGGSVSVNNSDEVIAPFYSIEIKNCKLIINGSAKCGFLVAEGAAKFTNCTLILNGNLTDDGGGLTYVFDNTTSSFKTITIAQSSAIINGNVGSNSGPLSGYMSNGNIISITNSYTVVNGDVENNAGGFIGAYNGLNRTATITGCYCIISSNLMAEFSGVLAGSYLGANGTVSIQSTYIICNIQNTAVSNPPCYISNYRTSLPPSITANVLGIWDVSGKNLNVDYAPNPTNGPILNLQTYQTWNSYSSFNTNILQNLSTTYYNPQNTSFQLKKYNNGTTQDFQLRNIKNIVNYNWILTNDDAIYNFDTTFLLEFNFLPGTTTVQIPINAYNSQQSSAYIEWGDGSAVQGPLTLPTVYSYTVSGTVFVAITGRVQQFGLLTNTAWSGSNRLTNVISFGSVGLKSLRNGFVGASNLISVPQNLPNTVENVASLFQGASSFNQSINIWDTAAVINMSSMFQDATAFNQPLNNWNTSAVVNMERMFQGATSFNQVISYWNVVLIPTEPTGFATNSALNPSFKPIWGTTGIVFTAISLSPLSVNELQNYSGMLTSNSNQPTSYSIVQQPGDMLYISGNTIYSRQPFTYNIIRTYTFIVQGFSAGVVVNQQMTLTIVDIPQPPTDITLTNNTIAENAPVGSLVGRLQTVDPDSNDRFIYSFVPGAGSTDNHLFVLNGSGLFSNTGFNYRDKSIYSVRIRSTDSTGYYMEKTLPIMVILPTATSMIINTLINTEKIINLGGISITGQPLIYTILTQPSFGTIIRVSNGIYKYTARINQPDHFLFQVQEGNMTSLPGNVAIQNFSEDDVRAISKRQGTLTFDNITYDGNTWTAGILQTETVVLLQNSMVFGMSIFYNGPV